MKWYILTDLEGACRVNRWDQTRVDELTPDKLYARRMLTAEINAAVQGLYDADHEADILVWDGHGNGGIDNTLLDERIALIARGSGIRPPYGLTAEHAGMLVLGQHPMAGTPRGTLAHTYSSRTVEEYRLNGQPIGELGARAVMAGALGARGVPTILVSGDDLACAEARALIPEVYVVPTKTSLGEELAEHRAPAAVYADLREQAAAAARAAANIPPVRWAPPYTLRARMKEGFGVEGYLRYDGAKQIDERTVEVVTDDLAKTWI